MLQFVFAVAVIVGGFMLINKRNKVRAKKPFADYYERKRKEFPWLDNWIKENGNPALSRADEGASYSTLASIVWFVICGGIGLIIAFFSDSWGVFFVSALIGLGIGELVGRGSRKDPTVLTNEEVGLTLECPSCGCPHAWVLLEEETFVEDIETTTETTTRKGYGQGDIIDWTMEGFKSDGTTVKETTVYYGRTERDFKCENCGHTEHNEYKAFWKHEPKLKHTVYNPPKQAWAAEYFAEQAKENRVNELYEQAKAAQTDSPAEAASAPNLEGIDNPEDLFKAGEKAKYNEDYATAFQLYLKAAEMGHRKAYCSVAEAYKSGEGVEKDYAKAIMWCEKIFDEISDGDDRINAIFDALPSIVEMYREGGYGIQRDLEKVRYWLQIGVDGTHGDADLKKELKEVEKELKKMK